MKNIMNDTMSRYMDLLQFSASEESSKNPTVTTELIESLKSSVNELHALIGRLRLHQVVYISSVVSYF